MVRLNLRSVFLLSVALILFGFLMLFLNLQSLNSSLNSTKFSQSLIQELNQSLSSLENAEINYRNYIINPDSSYLNSINKNIDDFRKSSQEVEQTTKNTIYYNSVISFKEKASERIAVIKQGIYISQNQGFEAAKKYFTSDIGSLNLDNIKELIRGIENQEAGNLAESEKNLFSLYQIIYFSFVILGLAILLIFITNYIFSARFSRKNKEISINKEYLLLGIGEEIVRALEGNLNILSSLDKDNLSFDTRISRFLSDLIRRSEEGLKNITDLRNILLFDKNRVKSMESLDIFEILKNLGIEASEKNFKNTQILGNRKLLEEGLSYIFNFFEDKEVTVKKYRENFYINIRLKAPVPRTKGNVFENPINSSEAKFYLGAEMIRQTNGKVLADKNVLTIILHKDTYSRPE